MLYSDSSDLGDTLPDQSRIEAELRQTVASTFIVEDYDNLTVKKVRASVVGALDLPDDFLREGLWKGKSKSIITDEVSRQERAAEEQSHAEIQPKTEKATSSTTAKTAAKADAPFDDEQAEARLAKKRKSSEAAPKSQKRRKTIESSPPPTLPESPRQEEDEDHASEDENEKPEREHTPEPTKPAAIGGDSDLSSLEDDAPPPKAKARKKRSSSPSATKAAKSSKTKPPKAEKKASKAPTDVSPDDAEIKKLQQHLQKCGIRKFWGTYLKIYDTPKQKIKHLRSLLEEVGMTGRFSEDKARQIKEERELKADLEDVTAMEQKWGRESEEQTRTRGVRALPGLEGIVDEDDVESN